MDQTFYIAVGIDLREIKCFLGVLLEMCLSFEYDYEAGSVTVHGITEDQMEDLEMSVSDDCLLSEPQNF